MQTRTVRLEARLYMTCATHGSPTATRTLPIWSDRSVARHPVLAGLCDIFSPAAPLAPCHTNDRRIFACCGPRHPDSPTFQDEAKPRNDKHTNFRNFLIGPQLLPPAFLTGFPTAASMNMIRAASQLTSE